MAEILVGGDRRARLAPPAAWRALTRFALLFMCAGLIDTALALIPFTPASAAWRFSTAAGIVAGMPVLVLGLTIFAIASAMLGRVWTVATATVLAGVLALAVILILGVLVTTLPDLLQTVPVSEQLGVKKGALRAVWLAVLYGSVAGAVFIFGVGRLRQSVGA
jgi:hypothetical protein